VKTIIEKIEQNHRTILICLLLFNFIFKIGVFYNTTSFRVSEAGSNYSFLSAIERGEAPALYEANYRSILGYIGYFFKSATGTLDTFFWFQALLATISIFILYLISSLSFKNRAAGILGVFLASIYMDYHLLTSVFYYQIFEIFFTLLAAYLALLIIQQKRFWQYAAIAAIPLIVYVSVFFRGTLSYFWLLLFSAAGFSIVINRKVGWAVKFVVTGIMILTLFSIFPHKTYRDTNAPAQNDFIFFGHTLYGGDGGEGAFIYEENKKRYEKKLNDYKEENNFDVLTTKEINAFQRKEIYEFITETPHKWVMLQIRKVAYTFGIVPIRDSLQILNAGKISINWLFAAFIIQLPFTLIILSFVIFVLLFFDFRDLRQPEFLFLLFLLFYLIGGTCLYGHYQERYRTVVVLAGMIPVTSFYMGKWLDFSVRKTISGYRLIFLAIVLMLIFSHWSYQAYDALILNKERYFDAVNRF
jgi:hypothetical protein